MLSAYAPLLLATGLAAATPDIAELALRDQYGHEDSVVAHNSAVVVVIVIDAKRLRKIKGWEKGLLARFPELEFMRVADIPTAPPVTEARVAEKLVQRVPQGVSVLIDMQRRWANTLSLDTSQPNLLVFNQQGKIAARYAGHPTEGFLERVSTRVAEVLEGS